MQGAQCLSHLLSRRGASGCSALPDSLPITDCPGRPLVVLPSALDFSPNYGSFYRLQWHAFPFSHSSLLGSERESSPPVRFLLVLRLVLSLPHICFWSYVSPQDHGSTGWGFTSFSAWVAAWRDMGTIPRCGIDRGGFIWRPWSRPAFLDCLCSFWVYIRCGSSDNWW